MTVSTGTMLEWVMRDPRREEWGFRWLTAHRAARAFRRWRGDFGALANVAHRRRETDEYRKTARRREGGLPADGDGDPHGFLELVVESPSREPIDRERLQHTLGRLTERQRALATLLARGFSYELIARDMRMPIGSVKSAVHAMRRKMEHAHEPHRSATAKRGGF